MVGKGYSFYLNNNNLFQYSVPRDKFGSEMTLMAMLCRGLILVDIYQSIRSVYLFNRKDLKCSGIVDRSNDETSFNMLPVTVVRSYSAICGTLCHKEVHGIVKRILRVKLLTFLQFQGLLVDDAILCTEQSSARRYAGKCD